jgi:hypothetical protein
MPVVEGCPKSLEQPFRSARIFTVVCELREQCRLLQNARTAFSDVLVRFRQVAAFFLKTGRRL